ncbi:hypothetical protein MASR1M50_05570 [Burkholderiales bacterium]
MRARLRAFFQHHHRHVLALFGGALLDADGGRQAGRPGADDDHVVFHGFARAVLLDDLLGGHGDFLVGFEIMGGMVGARPTPGLSAVRPILCSAARPIGDGLSPAFLAHPDSESSHELQH